MAIFEITDNIGSSTRFDPFIISDAVLDSGTKTSDTYSFGTSRTGEFSDLFEVTTVFGSGFTYSRGEPTGGEVRPPDGSNVSVAFRYLENDNTAMVSFGLEFEIAGLGGDLVDLVNHDATGEDFKNLFWAEALGGADLLRVDLDLVDWIAGDGADADAALSSFANAPAAWIGGDDRFDIFGSNENASIYGDYRAVAVNTVAVGGDDVVVARAGTGDDFDIFGDVRTVNGSLVGGDDTIDLGSVASVSGRIIGDAESAVAGTSVVGGDDTITTGSPAGALGVFVAGDVVFASGVYAEGGDDTIMAGDGNDTLTGDFGTVGAAITIGGDDTIRGGGGDDAIYGDFSFAFSGSLTGGDDTLFGEDGDDTLYGNGGSDILDGGAGTDEANFSGTDLTLARFVALGADTPVVYVAQAASGDVDTLIDIEIIEDGAQGTQVLLTSSLPRFDALQYAASYTDLAATFSGTSGEIEALAAEHFAFAGLFEGRVKDGADGTYLGVRFDAGEYRANYGDLAGLSDADVTLHWINNGVSEGRLGFDGLAYTASHEDLIAAFGTNEGAAVAHWQSSGRFEGREVTFSAEQYLANYADLQVAFGGDAALATQHYVSSGFAEGRAAIDPIRYLASNADLIEAFSAYGSSADLEAAGLSHFTGSGRFEGRTSNFDAAQYLDNYDDLREAFGFDVEAAEDHFVRFGYFEGRTDDDVYG